MRYEIWNRKLFIAVRLLLGLQYFLGGLNWFYKLYPFPSMSDPAMAAGKHAVLVVMIQTGWMFQAAKVIELLTGLALLFNRFVPLMLVMSFPVALSTFLLDAFIGPQVTGFIVGTTGFPVLWAAILDLIFFGGCVLAMQTYLMLALFRYYRPLFTPRAEYRMP